jgi:FMN phosphatase YigB (HAD superfamily)
VWDHDDIMMTVAAAYRIPDGALSPRLHEELCAAHAAPPHTATLDDAASVLRSLKTAPDGRPRRLVVSTMGLSKYQLPVMRALGLYELFDDVLTPDLTDHLKTARGYYARYLDAAGTYASARRINIGDNYEHDIEVPKSLGALAVLRLPEPELAAFTPFERAAHLAAYSATIQNYPTDRPVRAVPDAVVISLAELPAVIAHLEAVDQA